MDNLFKDIEEVTLEHIKTKRLDQLDVKISISKKDISNYEERIVKLKSMIDYYNHLKKNIKTSM